MTTVRRMLVTAATVVVAGALVSACGADEAPESLADQQAGSAAPSASPTGGASAPQEQEHVDAVEEMLTDYYAAVDAVAQGGYGDADATLRQFWGDPDAWSEMSAVYAQQAEQGLSVEGAIEVVAFDVTQYVPDPNDEGYEQVVVDVCTDVSGAVTLDADGEPVERAADAADRLVVTYRVQHQGAGDRWTINDRQVDLEGTC